MTIIFNGNNYKYELESVVKLFFPAQLFTLLYDVRDADGDLCFSRLKAGKSKTYLFVLVRLGDKTTRLSTKVDNDIHDYRKACELELSRLLFLCLNKLTGITPEWGLITGVRPVKRVNKMIKTGLPDDSIKKQLEKKYLVAKDKINLAIITANTQKEILGTLKDGSFSLYVSIPFCPTRCSYCSFVSQAIDNVMGIIPQYIDNLCEELKYTAEIAHKLNLRLDTIYFGGGTPTSINEYQLEKLMKTVSSSFDLSSLREYTVEAGRADTITKEKLEVIKANKATRISINPQTLNDDVLKAIGRNHTAQQVFESYELARKIGFYNINMDLIAGLPTDTIESFENTIDSVVGLSPESITVHTLSIKRAADLNRSDKNVLRNPAPAMIAYSSRILLNNGYLPYYLYRQKNTVGNLENTGYSKKGFESLYNIYIMEEVQSIIATGAGASTKLILKDKMDRIFNYKHPLEYNNHFDLMIQKKDAIIDFYNRKGINEKE